MLFSSLIPSLDISILYFYELELFIQFHDSGDGFLCFSEWVANNRIHVFSSCEISRKAFGDGEINCSRNPSNGQNKWKKVFQMGTRPFDGVKILHHFWLPDRILEKGLVGSLLVERHNCRLKFSLFRAFIYQLGALSVYGYKATSGCPKRV